MCITSVMHSRTLDCHCRQNPDSPPECALEAIGSVVQVPYEDLDQAPNVNARPVLRAVGGTRRRKR